ncbi:uncharacterized protein LOC122145514 [Tachysurus ichikawai]
MNIADITRGAGPKDLDEDSEWQSGPKFLSLPVNEWPIKSAKDVAAAARENITKIQKKTFVTTLTRAQLKNQEPEENESLIQTEPSRPPGGTVVQELIDVKRFSNLTRLIKTVTLVWRAAKKFLQVKTIKWEAVSSAGVITNVEREDAFKDLCLAVQRDVNYQTPQ